MRTKRKGTVWGAVFGNPNITNDPRKISGGTFVGLRPGKDGTVWGASFGNWDGTAQRIGTYDPTTGRTSAPVNRGGTMYVGSRRTWGVSFRD